MKPTAVALRERIARVPKLADLTADDQARAFRAAAQARIIREADKQITALSEDFDELVAAFLASRKSAETRRRYASGIRVFVAWCTAHGIRYPLLATSKDADLFASDLKGYSAATINSIISGVSSLFSTLVKWDKLPKTPFMKIARRIEEGRPHEIPTYREVMRILQEVKE